MRKTTRRFGPGRLLCATGLLGVPLVAFAQGDSPVTSRGWLGPLALGVFAIGYLLVVFEERTHLRKSIPMTVAAGLLWVFAASSIGESAGEQLRENVIEYAELFLFLLSAMTFVNTLEERQVFDVLRARLISRGLSLRGVFWATGVLAFVMSPIADNLTTALVMGAVAIAVGSKEPRFVAPACINIVVAANAGGAFSPFGDITTLMVWQRGKADFFEFFRLFIPSVLNWIVPAALMALTVPKTKPEASAGTVKLLPGAQVVIALFLATIAGTVLLHQVLHLPPMLGMMTGLGVLNLYGFFLQRKLRARADATAEFSPWSAATGEPPRQDGFDVFHLLARVEWDTLMFFYGVILCVGALHGLGYLDRAVHAVYDSWGPTNANVAVGVASAVFDNIPLMAAILSVSPEMNTAQWLLVTLTTGVGGSLLSVGSAAGVALMGQARGTYTFGSHLKWTWAIAIGYAVSIVAHVLINGR